MVAHPPHIPLCICRVLSGFASVAVATLHNLAANCFMQKYGEAMVSTVLQTLHMKSLLNGEKVYFPKEESSQKDAKNASYLWRFYKKMMVGGKSFCLRLYHNHLHRSASIFPSNCAGVSRDENAPLF